MRTKQEKRKKTGEFGGGGGEGKREKDGRFTKCTAFPPSLLPSLLTRLQCLSYTTCFVRCNDDGGDDDGPISEKEREENERERSPRNARIRRNGPTVHRSFFLDRQMNEYSPKSFRTPPRRRTRRRGGRMGGRRSGADVLRPLTDSPSRPGPACPPAHPSSIPSRIFIVSNRRRRRYMADTSQYLSEREREGREGKKERKKEGGDCFRGAAAPEIRRKSRHMCCPYSPDRDSLAARPLGWEVGIGLERGGRNTRLMRSSR